MNLWEIRSSVVLRPLALFTVDEFDHKPHGGTT